MKRIAAGHSQIGFVGLGRMGLSMCPALVGTGFQVTATDERAGARTDAMGCGAAWRDTPAQAAAAAGVLITMLPGSREVAAVMLGASGALAGMAAGATWIDMTSSSPDAVRQVRERPWRQVCKCWRRPSPAVSRRPVRGDCSCSPAAM